MNTEIKDAEPSDAEGIRLVHTETWLATYPNEDFGITYADIEAQVSNLTSVERLRDRLSKLDNNRHYWVAKSNNKIVGMCICIKEEDKNTLQAIYILPSFQGHGIGSKLMHQALEWFGQERDIVLGVVAYNTSAINFYKKFGFIENGERHDEIATLPSGKVLPEIEMIRRKD